MPRVTCSPSVGHAVPYVVGLGSQHQATLCLSFKFYGTDSFMELDPSSWFMGVIMSPLTFCKELIVLRIIRNTSKIPEVMTSIPFYCLNAEPAHNSPQVRENCPSCREPLNVKVTVTLFVQPFIWKERKKSSSTRMTLKVRHSFFSLVNLRALVRDEERWKAGWTVAKLSYVSLSSSRAQMHLLGTLSGKAEI